MNGKQISAVPGEGDMVKLWSLMSNQGDGFIAAVHGSTSLRGNGLLEDSKASFQWNVRLPITSASGESDTTTDATDSKTTVDGVTLRINGTEFGNSDEPHYITGGTDTNELYLLELDKTNLQQTFRMELWPLSRQVPNAGSYVRFRVYKRNNKKNNEFLGCNGEGIVSVMEQKEPAGSQFGDNFFPNPGTLFYLYDLGQD